MLQATRQPDPGFLLIFGGSGQFLFDRFGHKDAQGNATLGRNRLGPAEDRGPGFQAWSSYDRFPYLWVARQLSTAAFGYFAFTLPYRSR